MEDEDVVKEVVGSTVSFHSNRKDSESKHKRPRSLRVTAASIVDSDSFGRCIKMRTPEGTFTIPQQFVVAVQ